MSRVLLIESPRLESRAGSNPAAKVAPVTKLAVGNTLTLTGSLSLQMEVPMAKLSTSLTTFARKSFSFAILLTIGLAAAWCTGTGSLTLNA